MRGVTFDVMPRDNIGIVGESGCGKSTLTRLLAALEAPEQGEIMFQGKPLLPRNAAAPSWSRAGISSCCCRTPTTAFRRA